MPKIPRNSVRDYVLLMGLETVARSNDRVAADLLNGFTISLSAWTENRTKRSRSVSRIDSLSAPVIRFVVHVPILNRI